MQIGPAVPEKIFEGLLPYMGMVAILVMWPGPPRDPKIYVTKCALS